MSAPVSEAMLTDPGLSSAERLMIRRLLARMGGEVTGWERRSPRPYDLTVTGAMDGGGKWSAWLPLGIIREYANWTAPAVAAASDYPEMVRAGDWSGIRDSEPEAIWTIFESFAIFGRPTQAAVLRYVEAVRDLWRLRRQEARKEADTASPAYLRARNEHLAEVARTYKLLNGSQVGEARILLGGYSHLSKAVPHV